MWVLLVTWFVVNQPPVSSQSTFNSAKACNAARQAIMADQARLKASQEAEDARNRVGTLYYAPRPYPTVSAVCVPK